MITDAARTQRVEITVEGADNVNSETAVTQDSKAGETTENRQDWQDSLRGFLIEADAEQAGLLPPPVSGTVKRPRR